MLIERVFGIGGVLCVVLGAWLVVEFDLTGWAYFELVTSGAISAGFGVFFVYVGQQARQRRREPLRLGESGDPNAADRPRS